MIGEYRIRSTGQLIPASAALSGDGIAPLKLRPKESLALLNGTQVSTVLALSAAFDARRAFDTAVVIGAITTEAVLGSVTPFQHRIQEIRRHPGQTDVARRLR